MRIVIDQRYILKSDGKRWLQCKYLDGSYMDASGSIGVAQAKASDWEDVPISEDDWPETKKVE